MGDARKLEVEITPDMIAAGVRVIKENYFKICDGEDPSEIVRTVLLEMMAKCQSLPHEGRGNET